METEKQKSHSNKREKVIHPSSRCVATFDFELFSTAIEIGQK